MKWTTLLPLQALKRCCSHTRSVKTGRGPDRERDKRWWEDVYATGDDVIFRKTLRMKRETFNFILGEINHELVKEPTNMKPLRDSLSTR